MIKQDLISQILDKFAQKRADAELKAQQNLNFALKNEKFYKVFNKINGLNVDIAYLEFDNNVKEAQKLKKEQEKLKKQQEELLKEMNLSNLDITPNYECKLCCDKGIIDGKYCSCLKKEISSKLIENSCINFKDVNFEKSNLDIFSGETKNQMEKIYKIMQEFCEKYPNTNVKNIIFSGGTGTGKTYLTQCVATNLIQKGYYVYYTTAFNLANELLSYHFASMEEKGNILDKFLQCDLLIIDDLGVEPIRKNISIEYLLTIISERAITNKFTIISTNLSPEDILNRYGERIFSRLMDKSKSLLINFKGEDLRIKRK